MCDFKLYLAGQTPRSLTIIKELTRLLKDVYDGHFNLEVIDLIHSPELAEKAKILATPTLEKVSPEPKKRIIGDISDRDKVSAALNLLFLSRISFNGRGSSKAFTFVTKGSAKVPAIIVSPWFKQPS